MARFVAQGEGGTLSRADPQMMSRLDDGDPAEQRGLLEIEPILLCDVWDVCFFLYAARAESLPFVRGSSPTSREAGDEIPKGFDRGVFSSGPSALLFLEEYRRCAAVHSEADAGLRGIHLSSDFEAASKTTCFSNVGVCGPRPFLTCIMSRAQKW